MESNLYNSMHHAPHVECHFESGNSSNSTLTRCNLFSRMPSTDDIVHPIWGALLNPTTWTLPRIKKGTPKQLKTFRLQRLPAAI